MRLDEGAQGVGVDTGEGGDEMGEEALATHVADDFLGGVEGAGVVVVFEEVFEDAAEHFGVYAHFGVVGVVFVDGEVVFGEHLEEVAEEFGREAGGEAVEAVALEESAAEPGDAHGADGGDARVVGIALGAAVGVEPAVEEGFEGAVEKVGLLVGIGRLEEPMQEVGRTFAPGGAEGHAEPPLLLEEVEKDDAPEELFDVVANGFLLAVTGFGGVGGLRGAGEVLAHGGIAHHEVDKRLVVGFVAGEELAGEGFDREGLAQIVDVEFGIGVVGAPIDEPPEVFGRGATGLPGAEEEGEAASGGAGRGVVGFVAEGEAPLPFGAVFVVDEEEGAGVGVHDAPHELLHPDAVARHAHAVAHGHIEDVERFDAEVDVGHAGDGANARGAGHGKEVGMPIEQGLVEGVVHVFGTEEGLEHVTEEGGFAGIGLLEKLLEVGGSHGARE